MHLIQKLLIIDHVTHTCDSIYEHGIQLTGYIATVTLKYILHNDVINNHLQTMYSSQLTELSLKLETAHT
jgi:hypothetical protein